MVAKTDAADLGMPSVEPLGEHDGWRYVRVPSDVGTDAAVENVARLLEAPLIGAYVADSDAAAVYCADGSGLRGWLAINPSYDDGDPQHTEQWLDAEAHKDAAEAVARWAADHAPKKPSGAEIVSALAELEDPDLGAEVGERMLVFAEEGLRAVFGLLGFASLDEAVFMVGRG